MNFFEPAQLAGYAAFVLGVMAFLGKSDRRLKIFNASQSLVYGVHFLLLGNLPAMASSLVSATRSALALKFKSLYLAAAIIVVNLTAGVIFVRTPVGWLPVLASCAATVAIFTMSGVGLRAVLFCCTLAWLVNNIVSGSIGGTLLELTIATVNGRTIYQMLNERGGFVGRPAEEH
jgi:hypothetical protein